MEETYYSVIRRLSGGGGGNSTSTAPFALGAMEDYPVVTLISFLVIISFILIFDFFTKYLEFLLEDSPRYNRMVQNIYKELMQMGIISFCFVIFAAQAHDNPWVISLDFSHILLFFVAIYFVVHTFYLITVSIGASNHYTRLNAENAFELNTSKSQFTWLQNFIFNLSYFPFSSMREKFEFKLLHILFKETFAKLPDDFSFNLYLSKSFEQYSLMIMDFSPFSWAVVYMVVIANFIRIMIEGEADCVGHPAECALHTTQFLLGLAVVLCFYVIVVLLISRMYVIRLIHCAGVKSPAEYDDFLNFVAKEERISKTKSLKNMEEREVLTSEELKFLVDEFVDAKENNEENLVFRNITNALTKIWIRVMDVGYSIQVWYRIRMRKKVGPGDGAQEIRKPNLLRRTSEVGNDRDNFKNKSKSKDVQAQQLEEIRAAQAASEVAPVDPKNARQKLLSSLQSRMLNVRRLSANSENVANQVVETILNESTSSSKNNNAKKVNTSNLMSKRMKMSTRFRPPVIDEEVIQTSDTDEMKSDHHQQESPSYQLKPVEDYETLIDESALIQEVRAASRKGLLAPIDEDTPSSRRNSTSDSMNSRPPPMLGATARQISSVSFSNRNKSVSISNRHESSSSNSSKKTLSNKVSMSDRMKKQLEYSFSVSVNSSQLRNNMMKRMSKRIVEPINSNKGLVTDNTEVTNGGVTVTHSLNMEDEDLVYESVQYESIFAKYLKYRENNGNGSASTRHQSNWFTFRSHHSSKRNSARSSIDDNDILDKDYKDIFILQDPSYFFRAVEVALMLNSLFLALSTYYIRPLLPYTEYGWPLIISLPILLTFPCIGNMIKSASLIKAVTELQLEVIRDVLEEAEDMEILTEELRASIISKIEQIYKKIVQPANNRKELNAATALKQEVCIRSYFYIYLKCDVAYIYI